MPPRKRPQDYTGTQIARLNKERDEAAQRDAEITMATAEAEAAKLDEVVDLTPQPANEVDAAPVEVADATRKITMNTTLEQTTYGAGNTRDLKEGVTYILPKAWADHLDAKGFVHH